jgi:hypothetical protein
MPISAEEYAAIALAGYGGDIKGMNTDDSLAKDAHDHDRDYAGVKNSLVDVKDTSTHEYPTLKSTSESSDVVDILEEWYPEASDDNSSQSRNTNAGPNGRHGHDELDETLSNDDDGSTHYKTTEEKEDAGRSGHEVDASNVEGDESDDDSSSSCSETDSKEQEPVWSDDEVDESNVKYEEEVDAVSEENEEDDHVDDDDEDSHWLEDIPRNPRYRRKQVSPTRDEDDESNAQYEGDEDHEKAGDDDDHISNHLKKDAPRKLGLPKKPEPIRGKRKRGRPRKHEPPTLEGDSGDDDYERGRPRKMLKETKRKGGRPRKMVKETKSKRGQPRKMGKGTKGSGRRTTKMSKLTTRAPVAVLKAKTNEEPRREAGTEIGSSVYAKWLDDWYYWAVIVDIKRKRCSHFDQYSVRTTVFSEYVSKESLSHPVISCNFMTEISWNMCHERTFTPRKRCLRRMTKSHPPCPTRFARW